MIALLLLTHEPADRVRRMVEYWRKAVDPGEIVVAYGGPREEFGKIEGRKAFIDDPWLRTRDHQRERQSYTRMLKGAMDALEGAEWEWLYLAEYDMLPLDSSLLDRLRERALREGADLLGHRAWRIDDTLHPHYASHLATPEWLNWIGSVSRRSNKRVVLSCMGCGQFWGREALESVVAQGEPVRAYLELQLPTVAHHLGFRVRGLDEQDRFISNQVIPDAKPELLRDIGAWILHPVKKLWADNERSLPDPGRFIFPEKVELPVSPNLSISDVKGMEDGWRGDLSSVLKRISRVATGNGTLRILRGGHRFAVGFPEDRRAARVVLDLYHPHRFRGDMFRIYARGVLKFRLERRLLQASVGGGGEPASEWLQEAAAEGRVGFVGSNPVHGPRCLLGGLTGGEDPIPFVGKLGFDQSREAIMREASVLARLGGRFPGVLKPLSFESGSDWALLRLPYLGFRTPKGMDDSQVIQLLVQWLGDTRKPLGEIKWARRLLEVAENAGADSAWCAAMRKRMIRTALVHGDFAVWNLRMVPTGPCAIDWEWAEENGVAGVDLAHGLRQDAVMIRKLGPGKAVRHVLAWAEKRTWSAYLDASGWSGAKKDWLRFGLLHSHFNARSDSRKMLEHLGICFGEE